ncbi:BgtA-21314 [Blumeria graminis f. sp. tritici]|uniref:BgtA-21314 n=2 Tax=Blumeria graminis f. sp. tritici TaxID=62690 RepID=A0A9X9MK48_BLUGR|nr:hypothetical protein BGT96224_A21314 [Blumeria graminis f. sp. tritici 96224]VDB90696.1 BgtA-21314 [Blumeria graminis f. sp. tritici]
MSLGKIELYDFGHSESNMPEIADREKAFEKLPEEIIVQILQTADPNVFASLVLLNKRWHQVSSKASLYCHQISQCFSFSINNQALILQQDDEKNLPMLRRTFAQEAKRNLFEVYLRPRVTKVKFVFKLDNPDLALSGDSLHMISSPQGRYIVAYNSFGIHIIDLSGVDVKVKKRFRVLHKPKLLAITEDGSTLAILSTDLQVNIYNLSGSKPKRIRAMTLDHAPRSIALSPKGCVIAAAYDSGIEVSSLNPTNFSTERRSVKCSTVDSLTFSRSGTQMLGTTISSATPSTVILTAPYYDPGAAMPEDCISALWTTSILFPNVSRDCSHAILLPNSAEEEAIWSFTYDRAFESFRAVRLDDLRNGTTYFTGPTAKSSTEQKLLPTTVPAVNKSGQLVASSFQGSIWIYGIPEDLDYISTHKDSTNNHGESDLTALYSELGRSNSATSIRPSTLIHEQSCKMPQWQFLCDQFRNTFVEGQNIAFVENASALTWVHSQSSLYSDRLVVVAPDKENENGEPSANALLTILDFNFSHRDGVKEDITIDLNLVDSDILFGECCELEVKSSKCLSKTCPNQQNSSGLNAEAINDAKNNSFSNELLESGVQEVVPSTSDPRPISGYTNFPYHNEMSSAGDDALDAPYSHNSPRSRITLHRAATAVAINRIHNPQSSNNEYTQENYYAADEDHRTQPDLDVWNPPPPPYSPDLSLRESEDVMVEEPGGSNTSTISQNNICGISGLESPDTGSDDHFFSCKDSLSTSSEYRSEVNPLNRTLSNSEVKSTEWALGNEQQQRPVTSPISNGGSTKFSDKIPNNQGLCPYITRDLCMPQITSTINVAAASNSTSSKETITHACSEQSETLSSLSTPANGKSLAFQLKVNVENDLSQSRSAPTSTRIKSVRETCPATELLLTSPYETHRMKLQAQSYREREQIMAVSSMKIMQTNNDQNIFSEIASSSDGALINPEYKVASSKEISDHSFRKIDPRRHSSSTIQQPLPSIGRSQTMPLNSTSCHTKNVPSKLFTGKNCPTSEREPSHGKNATSRLSFRSSIFRQTSNNSAHNLGSISQSQISGTRPMTQYFDANYTHFVSDETATSESPVSPVIAQKSYRDKGMFGSMRLARKKVWTTSLRGEDKKTQNSKDLSYDPYEANPPKKIHRRQSLYIEPNTRHKDKCSLM